MRIHRDETLTIDEVEGGIRVVHLIGQALMDPREVEHVDEQLDSLIRSQETPRLVITLERVEQLSSLMLSALIKSRASVVARGGRVCLAAVPAALQSLFDLVKIADVFDTYPTSEAAIRSLRAESGDAR